MISITQSPKPAKYIDVKLKPLVSVVMPIYNCEHFLQRAIDSILKQTFQDFEFIIIDDGSTDSTPEILASYTDPRLRVIRQINVGLTKSLNRGIEIAEGEYIARMDADDIAYPTRFEEEIRVLLDGKIDLVWTNIVYIDDTDHEICERYQPSLEYTLGKLSDRFRLENHIIHPTVMFKRQAVLHLGGYDESYPTGQDGDLWFRMNKHGCKFAFISRTLLKHRVWLNNRTIIKHGYTDMNFVYALLCLRSRQPASSWEYIKVVKNPIQKLYLLIRWLVGEDNVQFLKRFKKFDHKEWHQAAKEV